MQDYTIGIGVSHYGPYSPGHRDSMRKLLGSKIRTIELTGSAYPEIAYAELCRSALATKLDVLIFMSPKMSFTVEAVRWLAALARHDKQIHKVGHGLNFCAVPLEVLLKMSEHSDRPGAYTNTGVIDTGFSEKARPFASPWKQQGDGSISVTPLSCCALEHCDGIYLSPEQSFFERAMSVDVRIIDHSRETGAVDVPAPTPITKRVKIGDAEMRLLNGILHNYAFCIPTFGGLDFDQQQDLWELERAGCTIIEYRDCPYIDQSRSELTRLALETGHDGIFFIDHDIIFRPIDALAIIAEAERLQDVVSAVYCMRKTAHSLIGAVRHEIGGEVGFFEDGGLYPALYSGLGFSAIPRQVIEALDEKLPLLWSDITKSLIRPYYALDVNGTYYSGEDASFCARVQGLTIRKIAGSGNQNGHDWDLEPSPEKALTRHKVWLDTRQRIFHRGSYNYGIEDHSIAVPRYAHFKGRLVATRGEVRRLLADELSPMALARAVGVDEEASEDGKHAILEEEAPCACGAAFSKHPVDSCPGYVPYDQVREATS